MAAGLGFKTFTTGEVLTAADTNGYLMQGINVFATTAARDAAITSPQEGQFAFTKDTNSLWYYDGAAWVASGATGDIEGVTAGIGISGGGTSGTVTVTNSMATAIDAKGDLVAGTAADTFSRLAVGANDTVLTADSTEATGLKWAAVASGSSFVGVGLQKTANQSISSGTFTAITWNSEEWDTSAFHDNATNNTRITIPTGKGGYYAIAGSIQMDGNATGNRAIELNVNGASTNYLYFLPPTTATNAPVFPMSYIIKVNVGDYIELFVYQTSGGALNVQGGAGLSKWQMQYLGA